MPTIHHPDLGRQVDLPASTCRVLVANAGWADGPLTNTDDGLERPAGNASTDQWRGYAERLGLDVPDNATRSDIVDLVDSR